MKKEILIEFVWGNLTEDLKKRVIDFWIMEKAITKKEDAENRVNDLLAIAKIDDTLVGVATGIVTPHPQLKSKVVFYRTYIAQDHRNNKIAQRLFLKSFEELDKIDDLKKDNVMGLLIAFQSPVLVENYIKDQKPVLEKFHDLTFIGYDQTGVPMRIAFFNNVSIKI
ncbi:hypothetical protein [Ekhidna sp.]|uniref:hypothetical protein n=1 Tax=Ekhidna sp. TaxID=2608089 RepID=UPI003C7B1181